MLGDSSPSPPFGAPTNAVWLRGRNSHSFSGRKGGEERCARHREGAQPTHLYQIWDPAAHPREPRCRPRYHPRELFAQCASGEATTLVCGLLGRDIGERDRWPPRNASRSPAREITAHPRV